MLIIILAILLVGVLSFLLATFVSFDRVVRRQYTEHHDSWCRDGRPFGIFWKPKDVHLFRSSLAFHKAWAVWLFITPSWADSDPLAIHLLRRYRIMVAVWNAGFLSLLTLIAFARTRAG